MKSILSLVFILILVGNIHAQEKPAPAPKKPAPPAPKYLIDGLDPLGRPNHPVLGILPAIASTDVNPDIVSKMGISYANGLKLNAHNPFGAVSKDKFDLIKDIISRLSREELRKNYYYESVGVEYLVRLDVNRFKMIIEMDTVRQKPQDPKSPIAKIGQTYHFFANLSASIIDVSTSDLLLSHCFSIQSDSKNANPKPGQTDSLVALIRLYDQIKQASSTYNALLAGVGTIDSILEVKKDRAKYVRSNPNKLMNMEEIGTYFDVSTLGEKYTVDGITYQHAEKIGNLYKSNDYRYWEMNYEVTNGERDILEAFNAGKKLLCSTGALPLSAKSPTSVIPAILIDTFQVKVKGFPELARMFQEATTDLLSRRSQMIDVVNRSSYRDLEIERAIQSRTKSDATQAGITKGAEYLLTGEILDYVFKQEPITKLEEIPPAAPAKTPAPPATTATTKDKDEKIATANKTAGNGTANGANKPAETKTETKPPAIEKPKLRFANTIVIGTKGTATAKVELRLISVKTGEIIWSKVLGAAASKDYPIDKKVTDKLIQREEVNALLVSNFAAANVNAISIGLMKPLPILKVLDADKKGIDRVLVGGGAQAGINPYMSMDVIEETTEMVDNQPLKRETVVAELRLKECYSETAAWKVHRGGEALQARMAANAKLYCKVKGL
ncbi:MAG: hypothetical protein WCR52_07930 [Bacteroidota bacterium]